MEFFSMDVNELAGAVGEKVISGNYQLLTPIASALVIGGSAVYTINQSVKKIVSSISGNKGNTTGLKLEAQRIGPFDGKIGNWQRWKNRTQCALDGSGYEKILTNESYALKNKLTNKAVFS